MESSKINPELLEKLSIFPPSRNWDNEELATRLREIRDILDSNSNIESIEFCYIGSGDSGDGLNHNVYLVDVTKEQTTLPNDLTEYFDNYMWQLGDHYVSGFEINDGGGIELSFFKKDNFVEGGIRGYYNVYEQEDQIVINTDIKNQQEGNKNQETETEVSQETEPIYLNPSVDAYEIKKDEPGTVWITLGNCSIYINNTDESICVRFYKLEDEDGEAIEEVHAMHKDFD
jgi:hypothetical protein